MAISQLPTIFILSLAMISCEDRCSRTSADFKKNDPRNEVQTMSEKNPLLKIRFDGEAVGPGKIPVGHLLSFLTNMNKALQRTAKSRR